MDYLYAFFGHFLQFLHAASEPVTVSLAIIAIVYAAIQKHESSRLLRSSSELKKESDELQQNTKRHAEEMRVQRNAMEGLTSEMRSIASSMSTKYIGGFPKNMSDICEVVSSADHKLDIQVDLVAYGHYSNPEGFQRYIDKIEDFAKRTPQTAIRLLVYSDEAAQSGRACQFGGPDAFRDEIGSERFQRYFRLYKCPGPPGTYEEFMECMLKEQESCRSRLARYSAIEIRYATLPFRLFLWIEDGEEAVFAFEMSARRRTISFRTRDGNLIHTFGELFEQNWRECAPKPALQETDKKSPKAITKVSQAEVPSLRALSARVGP